tara:strand:+ start:87 stop:599 length:513 start_codon:yes stop_codon:yes gene_type:complete
MDKLFENWRAYAHGKSILKEGGPRSSEAGSVRKEEIEAFLGAMEELKEILMAEDSIEKYRSLAEKWIEMVTIGPETIIPKFAKISEYISDQIEHESDMPSAGDEEEEEGLPFEGRRGIPWDESEAASPPEEGGTAGEDEGAEDDEPVEREYFDKEWRKESAIKLDKEEEK